MSSVCFDLNDTAALASLDTKFEGRVIGLLTCVVGLSFAVFTYGLHLNRRRLAPAKDRPLYVVTSQFIGLVLSYLASGAVELAWGSKDYPCILFFIGNLLWLPLNQGTFLINAIVTYNKIMLQARMKDVKAFTPEAYLSEKVRRSIERERRIIRGARWRTEGRAVIAFNLISFGTVFVVFFVNYFDRLHQFNFGCTGCRGNTRDREAVAALWLIIMVSSSALVVRAQRLGIFDSTGVIYDLRLNTLLFIVTGVLYFLFAFFDVGNVEHMNYFRWYVIASYSTTIGFGITVLRPSLRTYAWRSNLNKSPSRSSLVTLKYVLSFSEGLELFERYVVREFSVENFRFYTDISRWSEQARDPAMDTTSITGAIQQNARWIYDTYIGSRAVLPVNISSGAKGRLVRIFNQHKRGEPVQPETFDQARDEVYEVMEMDAFHRFKMSAEGSSLIRRLQSNVLSTSSGL